MALAYYSFAHRRSSAAFEIWKRRANPFPLMTESQFFHKLVDQGIVAPELSDPSDNGNGTERSICQQSEPCTLPSSCTVFQSSTLVSRIRPSWLSLWTMLKALPCRGVNRPRGATPRRGVVEPTPQPRVKVNVIARHLSVILFMIHTSVPTDSEQLITPANAP